MTSDIPDPELNAAVKVIRGQYAGAPELALVLGSGLNALIAAIETPAVFDAGELPGYPRSAVAGHAGRFVLGKLEGREVACIQGRVHAYEGHPVRDLTFPVRLAYLLGCRRLVVTNAAGGISPAMRPGTLMFITDHLTLARSGSLVRDAWSGIGRLPGLGEPYDPAWTGRAEQLALECGIAAHRGVYAYTAGPSYETAAEVKAFAGLGADAVGMSTVPEVLEARALGMKVLGVSIITNKAAGLSRAPLSHEEVLAAGRQAASSVERLIRALLRDVRAVTARSSSFS